MDKLRATAIIATFKMAQKKNKKTITLEEKRCFDHKNSITFGDEEADSPIQKLWRSLHSGSKTVTYGVGGGSCPGYGRWYAKATTIIVDGKQRTKSAQGVSKWMRFLLYDTLNHYVDVSNALPSIEKQLYEAFGIEHTSNMTTKRTDVARWLVQNGVESNLAKSLGKKIVLMLFYGASLTKPGGALMELFKKHDLVKHHQRFIEMLEPFRKCLKTSRKQLYERVDANFCADNGPREQRVISILLQSLERVVMTQANKHLEENGYTVTALIHDGTLFAKHNPNAAFPIEILKEIQNSVAKATGFELVFAQEKLEMPEDDAWRVAPSEAPGGVPTRGEIVVPRELKEPFVNYTANPPYGPSLETTHVLKDCMVGGIKRGHEDFVEECEGSQQQIVLGRDGSMCLRCEIDCCTVHPCGRKRQKTIEETEAMNRILAQGFFNLVSVQNNTTYNNYASEDIDCDVKIDPAHKTFIDNNFIFVQADGMVYDRKSWESWTKVGFENSFSSKKTFYRTSRGHDKKVSSAVLWWANCRVECSKLVHMPGQPQWLTHANPERLRMFNRWSDKGYEARPHASCQLFYDALLLLLGKQENVDFHLDVLAWLAQNPGKPPHVVYQLTGKQGTMKTEAFKAPATALYGDSNPVNSEFFQVDGTKKGELGLNMFNKHLAGKRLVLIDELNLDFSKKNNFDQVIKHTTSSNLNVRGMRAEYALEKDFSMWCITTNCQYAYEIDDPDDRRSIGFSGYDTVLTMYPTAEARAAFFAKVFNQLENEGGYGKLRHDLMHRALTKDKRSDGKDFTLFGGSILSMLPKDYADWRDKAMNKANTSIVNTARKEVQNTFDVFLSSVQSIVHTEEEVKACLQDPYTIPTDKNGYKINQPIAKKRGVFAYKVAFIHKKLTEFDGGSAQHVNIKVLSSRLKEIGLKRSQLYIPEDKKAAAVFFGFKTATWDLPDTLTTPEIPATEIDREASSDKDEAVTIEAQAP